MFKRLLTAALLLVVLCVTSHAEASGWFWRHVGGGLFIKHNYTINNGFLYSRSCGCRSIRGCSHFVIVRRIAPTAYMLGIVSNRSGYGSRSLDRITESVTRIAEGKAEFEAWSKAIEQAGFSGIAKGLTYGGGGYSGYGYGAEYSYAQPGTTHYSYSQFSSRYGQHDIGALYEQAGRLAEQAQGFGQKATERFVGLVESEGENQAEVARILASAQALAQVKGDGSRERRSVQFEVTTEPTGEVNIQRLEASTSAVMTRADAVLSIGALIKQDCAGCHTGEQPQGGLDLSAIGQWGDEERWHRYKAIRERLVHPDPEKRMPRGPDGPGHMLPAEKLQKWFLALSS